MKKQVEIWRLKSQVQELGLQKTVLKGVQLESCIKMQKELLEKIKVLQG